MTLNEKIDVLVQLRAILESSPEVDEILVESYKQNPWFTPENGRMALDSIRHQFLQKDLLQDWVGSYSINNTTKRKKIGLVLAGNIPAVGFHDILAVFLSDNISMIKYSSKDQVIIPYIIQKLKEMDERTSPYFIEVERLKDFDAVIATGGNNTSRYFEYYFSNVPNIIRKNRNGIGVIKGDESENDLYQMGFDIFSYFGLGCRNVSKVFLPKEYEIQKLLPIWDRHSEIIHHNKYKNNYDYNLALYILNKEGFLQSNCLLLKKDENVASRIASLHYSYYSGLEGLRNEIISKMDEIQCIVCVNGLEGLGTLRPGTTQKPGLYQYADSIDTMQFLSRL